MPLNKYNQQQKNNCPHTSFPLSLSSHHTHHVHLLPFKQRWQRLLLLPLDTIKPRGPLPKAQVRQELHPKLTQQVIHRHDPIMLPRLLSPARAARALNESRDTPGTRGRRSRRLVGGGCGAGGACAACLEKRGGWKERCVSGLALVWPRTVLRTTI